MYNVRVPKEGKERMTSSYLQTDNISNRVMLTIKFFFHDTK